MRYISLFAIIALTACATQSVGGLTRPTLITNPESYLATVGLNTHKKADAVNVVGPPHRQASAEGRDYWTYRLSDQGARARYTYIFEGDMLVDVRYNQDLGSFGYDGMTARKLQAR
jgi:hypothetical protein